MCCTHLLRVLLHTCGGASLAPLIHNPQDVINLWLKAIFRLIELLPTHPATAPIFQTKPAVLTIDSTRTDTQPATSIQSPSSKAEGEQQQGKGTQAPGAGTGAPIGTTQQVKQPTGHPVEVEILERQGKVNLGTSVFDTTIWMNMVLGVAGVGVVAYLVYRCVGGAAPSEPSNPSGLMKWSVRSKSKSTQAVSASRGSLLV